jgi:capsular exopolysaccharide synthesis family protein
MIDQEAHILDYVGVLLRRKWLILVFSTILVGAAVLKNHRVRPRYRATATIRVEGHRSPLAYLPESLRYGDYGDLDRTINTHLRMITSYPIIQEAVEAGLGHAVQRPDTNQPDPRVLAAQSAIRAKPVEETNLINIEGTHSDPRVAMNLVNATALAYKDYTSQKRDVKIRDNVQWLTREIAQLKEQVQSSEKALHQYRKKSKILSLASEKSLHLKELSAIRSDYNRIRVQRLELEAQIREIEQVLETKAGYIPAFLGEELLHSLNGQLISTQLKLTQLSKQYGPRHPKIIQAETHIQSLQGELSRSLQKAVQSMESKLRVLRTKEENLQGAMNAYKKKAIQFEGNQIQYALLDLEARSNRQLYDILVEKLKEINLVQNLEAEEVTIVEKAKLPGHPLQSQKELNLLIALLMGFTLGAAGALFLEYLDMGLKNREEVERYLKLPTLGIIPTLKRNRKPSRKEDYLKFIDQMRAEGSIAEAFDTLSVNLDMSSAERPVKILLVTSAIMGEGKTLTAINLAISATQSGKKVLLIDLDLRRPSLHKIYQLNGDQGFMDSLHSIYEINLNSGKLGPLALSDLFYLLKARSKTGRLSVEKNGTSVDLLVKSGNIYSILNRKLAKPRKMGELLLKQKALNKSKLDRALRIHKTSGQPLEELVMNLGYVNRDQLKTCLKRQMEESLQALLLLKGPSFQFIELDEVKTDPYIREIAQEKDFFKGLGSGNSSPILKGIAARSVIKTDIPGLFVSPCGKIPPNPVELMGSKRMAELFKTLREEFDLVIIDSSPILGAAHTSLSPSLVDGVILVSRSDTTNRKTVVEAKRQLELAKTPILGVVLNGIDLKRHYYRYYYGKHYYYRNEKEEKEAQGGKGEKQSRTEKTESKPSMEKEKRTPAPKKRANDLTTQKGKDQSKKRKVKAIATERGKRRRKTKILTLGKRETLALRPSGID